MFTKNSILDATIKEFFNNKNFFKDSMFIGDILEKDESKFEKIKDLFKKQIETETYKNKEGYTVTVTMPGFPKETIKVKTIDNVVNIKAEVKEVNGLVISRKFEHSLAFNKDVEKLKEIKLIDGILYLSFENIKKEQKIEEFEIK